MPDLGSILLLALPLLLLMMMFRAQRRRQRELQAVQDQLVAGAEVVTTSGLFGRIVAVDPEVVVLEPAPGVQVRWDRRAVLKVVSTVTEPGAPSDTAGPATTES